MPRGVRSGAVELCALMECVTSSVTALVTAPASQGRHTWSLAWRLSAVCSTNPTDACRPGHAVQPAREPARALKLADCSGPGLGQSGRARALPLANAGAARALLVWASPARAAPPAVRRAPRARPWSSTGSPRICCLCLRATSMAEVAGLSVPRCIR
ncbi:MAG: hypothetical protein J3K34DRAFT_411192 [Monoraphidium minutum]|nr:MAG: hypothetical protein J3K34DRAFT_411192 [Monoraphidium minutum]